MRNTAYLAPFALVVALLGLAIWLPFIPKPRPPRWEYTRVDADADASAKTMEDLDRLGSEGWEAYAYACSPPYYVGTWQLKRRK